MEFLPLLTLGLVQGLTEFLPISSSGHLWIVQYFWGFESDLTLEVFFHFASLLAVLVCLKKRLGELLFGIKCRLLRVKGYEEDSQLALQLIWATVVTVPVALLMNHYVLVNLDLSTVARGLILTGILIWVSTLIRGKVRHLGWKEATIIGLVQGLSVLPGISRSGITIVGLLLMGVERRRAAEFSFLLSIPTILGAMVFMFRDVPSLEFLSYGPFYVSAFLCFAVAAATIRFMLKYIHRWWGIWAAYCLLLGIGLFLVAS